MSSISTGLRSDLRLSHLSVRPGQSASVDVEVTNTSEVIDGVSAIVDGINPDWVRLDQPLVSLFPDASTAFKLTFDIPTTCPAGDYLIIVRMVSTTDPDRQTAHDFWLTVDPVIALELELRPRIVTGGRHARLGATVRNTGNCEAEIRVTAVEPTREVDCRVDPAAFIVASNDVALLDVDLSGPRPWFGQITQRTIIITARADDDVAVEQLATFNQKPRIPRGVITAITLGLIVLLWAAIFLWAISTFTGNDEPAKAVGTALLTGVDDIPLANIAASAEGTITASTTGEGLSRLTVAADRLGRDDTPIPAGSVTTDENGAFVLQSLLPGTYRFRVSGDGFTEVAFPVDPTASIRLRPNEPATGLDLVLTGETGSLTGKISLPPDAGAVELTVSVQQVVEQVSAPAADPGSADAGTDGADAQAGGSGAAVAAIPSIITTDGTIEILGLATPATYVVTVTGDGFETQQFEQRVEPGADTILNTVGLDATAGTISGTVRDGSGPLGEVVVTARSGDRELSVVTPTVGNTGQYEIVGLTTPQTWVLSFERPGYTSRTLALELGAGASRPGTDATLVGGSGTVSGIAVSRTGAALGGISVRIDGDRFTADTSTLTSGTAQAPTGSFTVSDLPVPGSYTVTMSGTGLQTETVAVRFDGAGQQTVGNVSMISSTATVRGTVMNSGVGRGGVTVSLTDGVTLTGDVIERTTVSATNPSGLFSFVAVDPGAYTLTFTSDAYDTQVILVNVTGGVDIDRTVTVVESAS